MGVGGGWGGWVCVCVWGGGGGLYPVRFWIGCSAPPVDSKCYKGKKKGGRNYAFCPIFFKK